MTPDFQKHLLTTLAEIESAGLYKRERVRATPQGREVVTADGRVIADISTLHP